jgi:hypothetical protein
MAWLTTAVAAGFADVERIQNGDDLKVLHGREDYKKLNTELRAKAGSRSARPDR